MTLGNAILTELALYGGYHLARHLYERTAAGDLRGLGAAGKTGGVTSSSFPSNFWTTRDRELETANWGNTPKFYAPRPPRDTTSTGTRY